MLGSVRLSPVPLVVSIEELSCLDGLIWFSNGDAASRKLQISQSAISRTAKRVANSFGLKLVKGRSEWQLLGDTRLLDLERSVHQAFRWERRLPIRVEAQYYSGPAFTNNLGREYLLGDFNLLNIQKPLEFLRAGIIDTWIGCHPDIPAPDDPDLDCFPLTRLPTRLAVSPGHPLLRLGSAISLEDVADYPCLALQDGAFPEVQKALSELGLWNTPSRMTRYKKEKWEGQTSDRVTIAYATSFTMSLFPCPMVVLPVEIPLEVGDTVVVKRAYADHPRFRLFLQRLKACAVQLAERYEDVSLAF
jgi:DNA-binding transcriptional LysR family regulator